MASDEYQEKLAKEAAFLKEQIEIEGLFDVLEVAPPEVFQDREYMEHCIKKSCKVYWKYLSEELKRPLNESLSEEEIKNFDVENNSDHDVHFVIFALDDLLSNDIHNSNKREIARIVHAMPDQYLKIEAVRSKLRALAEAKKDVTDQWVEDNLQRLDKDTDTALQECADHFKKFGYCDALAFCSDELKNDVASMTKLLLLTTQASDDPASLKPDENSGNFMEFMCENPRNDLTLAKLAVTSDGSAEPFTYASDELQENKELILHAVNRIENKWWEDHWNLLEDFTEDTRSKACRELKENVIENVLDCASLAGADGTDSPDKGKEAAVLQDGDIQRAMFAIYYPSIAGESKSKETVPGCCLEWQEANSAEFETLKKTYDQKVVDAREARKAKLEKNQEKDKGSCACTTM
eukprot:gnl/MRDRNA2_/MRDRNA2_49427_c0_seq1.p1 gnl/MRDRNA2_/MRDRNA2_49427_c0~~gnl/MRDRNA2_/MRDRNA2_49427_c0_seq1.p1  ORF type:complete len:446 (+),score=80.51 gnl/MRDRNA2_/MRDRNA2_49427_c0_seq1:115-1338(+)